MAQKQSPQTFGKVRGTILYPSNDLYLHKDDLIAYLNNVIISLQENNNWDKADILKDIKNSLINYEVRK